MAGGTTVTCGQGTQKYALETVGKGYYEVIGTLGADGTISEMNAVYMGETLGKWACRADAPCARVPTVTDRHAVRARPIAARRYRHVRRDGQALAPVPRHLLMWVGACVRRRRAAGGIKVGARARAVRPRHNRHCAGRSAEARAVGAIS